MQDIDLLQEHFCLFKGNFLQLLIFLQSILCIRLQQRSAQEILDDVSKVQERYRLLLAAKVSVN